jgi:putative transposase
VGCIKVKWHREIEGLVKRVTITERNGKYYAAFSAEIKNVDTPQKTGGFTVGIDFGIKTFAVVSDGTAIANPKFLKTSEAAVAFAQQNLSRKHKGSSHRKKARIRLSRIHEKIANQRLDFAHKTANRLVADYDCLVFEDLDIKRMLEDKQHPGNKNIHNGINDAAWGLTLRLIEGYKAEKAGCSVTKIDPRNTSQLCSGCGAMVKKALSVRKHSCLSCGLELDRDLNAARNILQRARTEPSDQEIDF